MSAQHTPGPKLPGRTVKAQQTLLPVSWGVKEASRFPKSFGPFASEAAALECVAEEPGARTMFVNAWAAVAKATGGAA